MKRIYYILTFGLLALAFSSCSDDDWFESSQDLDEYNTSGDMSVNLRVNLPAFQDTRSSVVTGDEDYVKSMTLLCFNSSHLFIGAADITPTQSTQNPDHGVISTKTTETTTVGGETTVVEVYDSIVPSQTVCVHFIANKKWKPTAETEADQYSSEGVFTAADFGKRDTEILKEVSERLTVNKSDKVTYWGYHYANNSGEMQQWLMSENVVYMLRDRAKIVINKVYMYEDENNPGEVESNNDIATIDWIAVNGLNKGYLAPVDMSKLPSDPYWGYYETTDPSDIAVTTPKWTTVQGVQVFNQTSTSTPCNGGGRYFTPSDNVASTKAFIEANWVPAFNANATPTINANHTLYVFEDENKRDNPRKDPIRIIMRVHYKTDEAGKYYYHPILLMTNEKKQFVIVRNHTYQFTIGNLPRELGYETLDEAITTKEFSNNKMLAINERVTEVSYAGGKLRIPQTHYMFLSHDELDGQAAVNGVNYYYKDFTFYYTTTDASELNSITTASFGVELDANNTVAQKAEVLSVTGSNGNFTGTVRVYFVNITSTPKHGELIISHPKKGLERKIFLYSVTEFDPNITALTATGSNSSNGYPLYQLSFTVPKEYPTGLYPITVEMATSTLRPYHDGMNNTLTARNGSFSVNLKSTTAANNASKVVEGDLETYANRAWQTTNKQDWNYNADDWRFWYNYSIDSPAYQMNDDDILLDEDGMPTQVDKTYTFYFEDVGSSDFRETPTTQVGLYFYINYFGGIRARSVTGLSDDR